ncbi:MAG TPA: ABC transporter permease [Opitutaceae bacterium]|jgi:spermidine/putrescine transport system permease protein
MSGRGQRPGAGAWLLLFPLLLWSLAFIVAPTAILVVYAFCQRDEIGRVVFSFTLENFQRVLDPVFLRIFGRSTAYAALTTAICLLAGFPAAWHIARSQPRTRNRLIMLVMIPFWTSFLIRTYAWMTILKQGGLLNGLLSYLGVIGSPVEFLYTPGAVILGLVYAYLPFMILPIYASAEKVDQALIEAAHDLGAGPLRVFTTVIIPLTRPGIAAGILLVFVPAVGMFAVTDLMGGARVMLIGNVIENQFLAARNWPFGAALGVAFLGMFAVVYALLARRAKAA